MDAEGMFSGSQAADRIVPGAVCHTYLDHSQLLVHHKVVWEKAMEERRLRAVGACCR